MQVLDRSSVGHADWRSIFSRRIVVDGQYMSVTVKGSLVRISLTVTNHDVETRDVNVLHHDGIEICLSLVHKLGKGLEIVGCKQLVASLFILD